jgi:hypothetical protein
MYRPNNWFNPFYNKNYNKALVIGSYKGTPKDIFELGADSMLKALKKQGLTGYVQGLEVRPNWIGDDNIGYSCIGADYIVDFVTPNKPNNRINFVRLDIGTLVFIPD